MGGGVEILEVSRIPFPPLPEKPLPIKLSLFDSIWIALPPVQRILLYPPPHPPISFPSLLHLLKSSLTATLLDFPPLAGKLTYVSSTGDVEIDLSAPEVTFVGAESDLDLRRLAASEVHDVTSFSKLVPAMDFGVLPFPVFAVQVTRFPCGGVAVGYSVHHAIVDGKAMQQFVQAWASTSRAKMNGLDLSTKPSIFYDRSVIKHPRGVEIAREFLKSMAPSLPNTGCSPTLSGIDRSLHLIRGTFVLGVPSVRHLKRRATGEEPPSTFSAISAHVWSCIVRSKPFDDPSEQTVFCFLMDCRARLDPPVPEGYFGNCVRSVISRVSVGELVAGDGLINACKAIRRSIDEVAKDPLSDCESGITNFNEDLESRIVVKAIASPRFRVYEADFGWGRPDRFESVSMNRAGEFALVGGKEEGAVQVSIVLEPDQAETFAELFSGGLDG